MVSLNPLTSGLLVASRDAVEPRRAEVLRAFSVDPRDGAGVDRLDLFNEESSGGDTAISPQRIAALRERIAQGSYLTAEKLDVVADRLHTEIFGR